jgi:hypothetical protein
MRSVTGTYDEDNEYSGSMKGREYLDKLSTYQADICCIELTGCL